MPDFHTYSNILIDLFGHISTPSAVPIRHNTESNILHHIVHGVVTGLGIL